MVDLAKEKFVTEDELMALDEDARVEVIDGEFVEMNPVGGEHHDIAGNIYDILQPHVKANKLGLVFMHGLIYLIHQKDRAVHNALVPDVSFISRVSIPKTWDIEKPFPGAPSLAVEVVSPGDDANVLSKRVQLYLKARTQQIWVVYPDSQEVHQYRADLPDTVKIYRNEAEIEVSALFPGLRIIANSFFELPDLGD
jgi:Uma2 family endonuclease